ncbi:MAG: tetratricopeptide repeat protein, partial [Chloroflexales bacterium]|nr:tetratricopeptide repeat protein [Chloroflexales bacterium]
GNLDGAQQEFQRALDLSGGVDGEALVGLGDVARLRGDYNGAQALYNQALAQDGGLVSATLGLGQAAAGQGNWAVALGQFQSAADRAPNDPLARFWIGEALLRQNRIDEAMAAYQRALELRGEAGFPEALLGMAQAQRAKNDVPAAEASIAAALRQRPGYAEGLLFSGKLKQEQGQNDEALRLYSAAINANNRLAEPYFRRALLAMQRNDLGQARDDLTRATTIQPNFPEAYYWLGRAYYAEDNSVAALQAFQQAVAQAGTYPEALLYQGLVQLRAGDRASAADAFRTVAQADASGEWGTRAQQELARLGQ